MATSIKGLQQFFSRSRRLALNHVLRVWAAALRKMSTRDVVAFLCGLLLEGASMDLCFGPMLAVLVYLQLLGSSISVAERGFNRQALGFLLPRGVCGYVFLAGF